MFNSTKNAIFFSKYFFRNISTKVTRNEEYGKLSICNLKFFRNLLGSENVKNSNLDEYNYDFMKWYKG